MILLCTGLAGIAQPTNSFFEFANAQAGRRYSQVPHQVLAFYYPWYGTPERHGHWVHWTKINPDRHDIGSARHYPVQGAYDSWDPAIVDWHIDLARTNGITGFIASWWGQRTFEDGALPVILERADKKDFKVSVYWETAPGKGSDQVGRAVNDLVYLLNRYGTNRAFLKVDGKPVIFVYGRVMGQIPLESWPAIITETRERAGDFLLIADGYEANYARLFDGVHTYNIAGAVAGKTATALRAFIAPEYSGDVHLARSRGRISCVTVIPGYDDTKVRKPGFTADRLGGLTYRVLWDEAIRANPDWILVTTWNEWHEGSEIEPSFEEGMKYISLTGEYAPRFRDSPPVAGSAPAGLTPESLRRLQHFYSGRTVGLLPGASEEVLFWLHCLGANVRELNWSDLPDPSRFNARDLPLVLYAGGEHYTGTVGTPGDVKQALVRYLGAGGFLVFLPNEPWPFYYDDSQKGRPDPITADFGLPVVMGPEQLAVRQTTFVINTNALPGFAVTAKASLAGDLRWRPCVPMQVPKGDFYLPLVQLRNAQGQFDGDAAVYLEHKTPPLAPGRVIYVWMRLPDALGVDAFFPSLFQFIATKVTWPE